MNIAVATITLARTKAEAALLLQSIKVLSQLELPIFIADRTENRRFKRKLRSIHRTTVFDSTDLVSQARDAIYRAASAADVVVYTEPDKIQFFKRTLPRLLSSFENGTILIPSRSRKSFRTYSRMQQRIEKAINDLCSIFLGARGDYLYGPLIFEGSLAKKLASIPTHFGWGWRLKFLKNGLDERKQLSFLHADLPCPPGQSKDTPEEWLHRMKQYCQNMSALLSDRTPRECQAAARLLPGFGNTHWRKAD